MGRPVVSTDARAFLMVAAIGAYAVCLSVVAAPRIGRWTFYFLYSEWAPTVQALALVSGLALPGVVALLVTRRQFSDARAISLAGTWIMTTAAIAGYVTFRMLDLRSMTDVERPVIRALQLTLLLLLGGSPRSMLGLSGAAIAGTLAGSFWPRGAVWRLARHVGSGLRRHAHSGRPTLALVSLGLSVTGQLWLTTAMSASSSAAMDAAVICLIAFAVAAFLAVRSLPNLAAVVSLVLSVFWLFQIVAVLSRA